MNREWRGWRSWTRPTSPGATRFPALLKLHPTRHRWASAGASFADHHGWQVPGYFTWAQKEAEPLLKSAAVGDMSWMTKLDLKGFGLKTPPAIHDGRAWRLGQEHYLVTSNPEKRDNVLAQ